MVYFTVVYHLLVSLTNYSFILSKRSWLMVLSTVIAHGKTYTEHSTGLRLAVSLRTARLKGSMAAKETHERGVYYWA